MAALGALIRKRRVEFSSGIERLDRVVRVCHGSQTQLLGAPGTGKTALAMAYAASVLASGGRVAWVSPRAFSGARLAAAPGYAPCWEHAISFYRPDLAALVALAPRADLVVLEHYEHYCTKREDIDAIVEWAHRLAPALIVTGTLCRCERELVPFWGGFPYATVTLAREGAREVIAQHGIHSFRLTAAPELQTPAPEPIPATLCEPESGSPWGLDTPRKRRRLFSSEPGSEPGSERGGERGSEREARVEYSPSRSPIRSPSRSPESQGGSEEYT